MELWQTAMITILGGGFTGACVVKFLGKKFVETQLKKSVEQYKHDLNVKQDEIKTDLQIFANQQTFKTDQVLGKRFAILEDIYGKYCEVDDEFKVIKSSVNFLKGRELSEVEYFENYAKVLLKIADVIGGSVEKVAKLIQAVKSGAIYLDEELESKLYDPLQEFNNFLGEKNSRLKEATLEIKQLIADQRFSRELIQMNLDEFILEIEDARRKTTSSGLRALKQMIRKEFMPNT